MGLDYRSHIEYRWGGEGLRKSLVRWAASINDGKGGGKIVAEDESGSSMHCYAFKVKDLSLVIFLYILDVKRCMGKVLLYKKATLSLSLCDMRLHLPLLVIISILL